MSAVLDAISAGCCRAKSDVYRDYGRTRSPARKVDEAQRTAAKWRLGEPNPGSTSVARIGVVATAGAGGDLQPLIAAALALRARGHDILFLGDSSVQRAVASLDVEVSLLSPELDLGPRLVAAVRSAMETTGGDTSAAGPLVRDEMSEWARDMAGPVTDALDGYSPATAVTSLFGVEVMAETEPQYPWAVINSTFYVGPRPPRSIEEDFAPRAVPLIQRFASPGSSSRSARSYRTTCRLLPRPRRLCQISLSGWF